MSSHEIILPSLVIFGAYLLGSISTAIITCRLMGLPDPRTQGSHNPGATNVLRLGGKKAAAITLLGDVLKGVIPVLIAQFASLSSEMVSATALAAFLGHLYPVYYRFQGGKGVATAIGVLLAMTWQVGLAAVATWLLMARLFRISSLSALTAALLTPLYMWLLRPEPAFISVAIVLSILLFWRHRSNIHNLISGKEGKIR